MPKDCQVWQYATAMLVVVVVGALSWNGTVDSSVFASLATLCLGYVFGKQTSNGGAAK